MKGIFDFDEIEPLLRSSNTYWVCRYFWEEAIILSKEKQFEIDDSIIDNENHLLVEYGFLPSMNGISFGTPLHCAADEGHL